MSYGKHAAALGDPLSFPVEAFEPCEEVPAPVCGFFLTLAALHNDLKNIPLGMALLDEVSSNAPPDRTAEKGQLAGLQSHLLRLVAALIHELLHLIDDNEQTILHESFSSALKRCSSAERAAWESLRAAAASSPRNDPLTRALLLVRNKVGFHYDWKEIARGYQLAFRRSERHGAPRLSGGRNLDASRFHFADAAMQAYALGELGGDGFKQISPHVERVNFALHGLVLSFIQGRGFAFRRSSEAE